MVPLPTALLISPEAPYPPAGGGALRTASLIEYLVPRYGLELILFREPGAPDPRDALPRQVRDACVIDLPFHSRAAAARALRNARRVLRATPPLNDRFGGFEDRIDALLAGRRYDLAVIEHFWCAPYWTSIAPRAGRVVLDLHNVESLLYARCAGAEPWPVSAAMRRFARACRKLERAWLPRFSFVLVASKTDADAVKRLADVPVRVYPNALPDIAPLGAPEQDVVAFSGNLEYLPNVSAVRFFRREIWPRLRERWPNLRWRIIGKNPSGIAREVDGDQRIEVSGPVADAVAALAAAKVVVAARLAGRGPPG
jgi:hypothetical protein